MPSEHLLHNRSHVRELVVVGEVREPVFPYHSIQFFLRYALLVGMHRHGEDECFEYGLSLE